MNKGEWGQRESLKEKLEKKVHDRKVEEIMLTQFRIAAPERRVREKGKTNGKACGFIHTLSGHMPLPVILFTRNLVHFKVTALCVFSFPFRCHP